MFFKRLDRGSTGIFIDRSGIEAVRLNSSKNRIMRNLKITFKSSIIDGNFTDATLYDPQMLTKHLIDAVLGLGMQKSDGMYDVRICIDDYFTNTLILEMAALPDDRSFAAKILEKKLHELYPFLNNRELIITYSVLPVSSRKIEYHNDERGPIGSDKSLDLEPGVKVLVTFFLKSLSTALKSACSKAEIRVSGLETAWNSFLSSYGKLTAEILQKKWALCVAGRKSSTLIIFKNSNPLFIRRINRGFEDVAAHEIVREIKKSISFYFFSNKGGMFSKKLEKNIQKIDVFLQFTSGHIDFVLGMSDQDLIDLKKGFTLFDTPGENLFSFGPNISNNISNNKEIIRNNKKIVDNNKKNVIDNDKNGIKDEEELELDSSNALGIFSICAALGGHVI